MSKLTLFDLPSCPKKGRTACWSYNPWKTRLALNFKNIRDYETIWLEYPDIEPTISPHIPPNQPPAAPYTIPTVKIGDEYLMDSFLIAQRLEQAYPAPTYPSLHLDSPVLPKVQKLAPKAFEALRANWAPFVPQNLLSERSEKYFQRTRKERLGKSLREFHEQDGGEECWIEALPGLKALGDLLGKEGGPFFLGEIASYADFVVVGWLQFLRRIDEEALFKRVVGVEPRLGTLYEACKPWLERDDY